MNKPIEITIRTVPFIVYLIVAVIGGYAISEERYYTGAIMLISLFVLASFRWSYKLISAVGGIQLTVGFLGIILKKKQLQISDYKYIRNRVQFNGIRFSGNTCVTELVGTQGNVLSLREESIGFTSEIPSEAEVFINKVVELTHVSRGENLIENP